MRRLKLEFVVLFALMLLQSAFSQEERPRIAVLDFQSIGCDSSLGLAASEILRTELGSLGIYRIIERAQLMKVMQEQSLQLSGTVDELAVVEIGKLLGAKMVVVGSLVRTGKTFTLNSRFIDVETAEVQKSQNIRGNSEDEISNMCSSLAKVISGPSGDSGGLVKDDALGRIWLVQESDYLGIWTRRGKSNVFDAIWLLIKDGLHAELTINEPAGKTIEIKRTDRGKALGSYRGTLATNERVYSGTVDWSKQVSWTSNVYFDSPAISSGVGATWIVREGDYIGIWRRIGQTNNFKATYFLTKNIVAAELVVESNENDRVRIKRSSKTGVLGFYQGTFTGSLKHLSGNVDWSSSVVWSAEVFY